MPDLAPPDEPDLALDPDLDSDLVLDDSVGWRFDTTYARLPESFFERVRPTPVARPEVVVFHHRLARELGLDAEKLARPEAAGLFTGNLTDDTLPEGVEPIAQAYAGHQFGYFTMLGDGRAILLGEHLAPGGRRVDIQWKGTGRTRFSRGGDGRAALGPMLREHVIGEAMHGLGIPTSRSLAVATTGEAVRRETLLPGAVLTRVATSHLRVGTFEYAAARRAPGGEPDLLRALADYTIERHAPELGEGDAPYLGLLDAVVELQASLVARWMLVGFVHGVMNTDNVAISGETIDYGPCAFLDAYDIDTVFSSIDRDGRYAYGNQPAIAQWNLARFAECLLPLVDDDPERAAEPARESVDRFSEHFERHWLGGLKNKLGWLTDEPEDGERIDRFLELMQEHGSDFTNTFRALTADRSPSDDPGWLEWFDEWRARVERQPRERDEVLDHMRRHNPAVIPRNHKVEEALDTAWRDGDLGPFERLLEALEDPYDHERERGDYQQPAPPGSPPYRTFCGT